MYVWEPECVRASDADSPALKPSLQAFAIVLNPFVAFKMSTHKKRKAPNPGAKLTVWKNGISALNRFLLDCWRLTKIRSWDVRLSPVSAVESRRDGTEKRETLP